MIKVTQLKLDTEVLDKYAEHLGVNMDRAIAAIAHQVEGYAKDNAPVDTGALKNSLNTSKEGEAKYYVQDGVEYGLFVELGTYKMSAQPFLIPAMEQASKDVASAVEKELPK